MLIVLGIPVLFVVLFLMVSKTIRSHQSTLLSLRLKDHETKRVEMEQLKWKSVFLLVLFLLFLFFSPFLFAGLLMGLVTIDLNESAIFTLSGLLVVVFVLMPLILGMRGLLIVQKSKRIHDTLCVAQHDAIETNELIQEFPNQIQALLENESIAINAKTLMMVLKTNDLVFVQALLKRDSSIATHDALVSATSSMVSLDILNVLLQYIKPVGSKAIDQAALNDQLEKVKALHDAGSVLSEKGWNQVIHFERQSIIRFGVSHGLISSDQVDSIRKKFRGV